MLLRGVLTAMVAVVLFPSDGRTADPQPQTSRFLQSVPDNSLVFAHIEVAHLWKSPLGDRIRKADRTAWDRALAWISELPGNWSVEKVKSVSVWMLPPANNEPDLRLGFSVQLHQAVDVAACVKQLQARFPQGEIELQRGIVTLKFPDDDPQRIFLDVQDPKCILGVVGQKPAALKPVARNGESALAPAFKQAAAGTPFVLAVNPARLPEELHKDTLPVELRVFQPLFHSQFVLATGTLENEVAKFHIRVESQKDEQSRDVEKSAAAIRSLLEDSLSAEIKTAQSAIPAIRGMVPFLEIFLKAVQSAEVLQKNRQTQADFRFPIASAVSGFITAFAGQDVTLHNDQKEQLKRLSRAMLSHESKHGTLPASQIVGKKGQKLLSWRVSILPELGLEKLYEKFKLDEPWNSAHNKKVLDENPMPEVFARPGSDQRKSKQTQYQVFQGQGALFDPLLPTRLTDVTDGLSNTILLVVAKKAVPWTSPNELDFDPEQDQRGLLHAVHERFAVSMADGSYRSIKSTVSQVTFNALITRSGGEVTTDE